MRQKLNENPVAQIALVGVLVVVVGLFLLNSLGQGEEAEGGAATSSEEAVPATPTEAAAPEGAAPASATASIVAPAQQALPRPVDRAYREGKTVVLLVYRPGGIDDHRLELATEGIEGMSKVALFRVPAKKITRYARITGPLGVNQAPALIVVRPRHLNDGGQAAATVDYGFRGAAEVRQAVVDAGYKGPELSYAPN